MLTRVDVRGHPDADLARLLPRPGPLDAGPVAVVRAILADVRDRGDAAVADYTQRFDGVAPGPTRVAPADILAALDAVEPALRAALEYAATAIRTYHELQVPPPHELRRGGLVVRGEERPVDRAGCYVPGGRAVYPSTVLMTAVPARVAGVGQVVLCVPPGPDGKVPVATLAAAAVAGVDEVHAVGGAQAIAAMAYGTDSIPAVDVIVGPGNLYVAVAKREVAAEGRVAVPAAFAGPSEVVVVADGTTDPAWAAADLLVQAEHGPDGLAWLVTWSDEVAAAVEGELERLLVDAPRRADIEATFAAGGYVALVDSARQALEVVNLVAPEHLELQCAGAEEMVAGVRHAGAVFLGPWSPASVGDYVAGPSHVLPTFGSARFAGALTVGDFTKAIHIVSLDRDALVEAAPHVTALAEAEGLAAHAASVRLRVGS